MYIASCLLSPQLSELVLKFLQTSGYCSVPQILQLYVSGSRLAHSSPAALPSGIFGMDDDIDGAMQHAPQCFLQSINQPLYA